MKDLLAERLLTKIMNWNEDKVMKELAAIQFMAYTKYDNYDQFMPGTRFLGSLAQWLYQFDESEREIMYNFVKKKLIFISTRQMSYLITLLYKMLIMTTIAKKVADDINMQQYYIRKIEASEEFSQHKRMSLFVGLSDGAHMDVIRRTSGLNNEQVLTNYFPDDDKICDLIKSLKESRELSSIAEEERKFETLFLIDDFTASGSSFIRLDKKDGKYHGKLKKVIDKIFITTDNDKTNFKDIFKSDVSIQIFFCVATEYALNTIEAELNQYLSTLKLPNKFRIRVDCVQKIEDKIADIIKEDNTLIDIIKKPQYFNPDVGAKDSYQNGKHNEPYLGYNEGALPVVLSHNTPNNSLPTLWQPQKDGQYQSLFPRINRH